MSEFDSYFPYTHGAEQFESWRFDRDHATPVEVIVSMAAFGENGEPAAGSMSPAASHGQPQDEVLRVQISEEEDPDGFKRQLAAKEAEANSAMANFLRVHDIDPEHVVVLSPQTDKHVKANGIIVKFTDGEMSTKHIVKQTAEPCTVLIHEAQHGDDELDPTVLAIRPADCPTIILRSSGPSRSDPDKVTEYLTLVHGGWQFLEAGAVSAALDTLAEMGVDIAGSTAYIARGGVEFGYTGKSDPQEGADERFQNPTWQEGYTHNLRSLLEEDAYGNTMGFDIDMPGFAMHQLREAGITQNQIYFDTTDTTGDNGHASHKRKMNGQQLDSLRDIVLARFE